MLRSGGEGLGPSVSKGCDVCVDLIAGNLRIEWHTIGSFKIDG